MIDLLNFLIAIGIGVSIGTLISYLLWKRITK
jgi:NhaP-type Na+/H+ or K+/H+ antiporter